MVIQRCYTVFHKLIEVFVYQHKRYPKKQNKQKRRVNNSTKIEYNVTACDASSAHLTNPLVVYLNLDCTIIVESQKYRPELVTFLKLNRNREITSIYDVKERNVWKAENPRN